VVGGAEVEQGGRNFGAVARKKKREGSAVPYGTDLLLEPYRFATVQIFYNVNHKN
jgi:hypothetical protein